MSQELKRWRLLVEALRERRGFEKIGRLAIDDEKTDQLSRCMDLVSQ